MRYAAAILVAILVGAHPSPSQTQPLAQIGFLRGVLLERDASPNGEFAIRASTNEVIRYTFDPKTYVEREQLPIDVPRLRAGDQVEVISDQLSGSLLRYARTIHVMNAAPQPPAPAQIRSRVFRPITESLLAPPRGDLTFSGVVSHSVDGQLVIHTRTAGDQTFRLRADTKFLSDGNFAAAIDVRPNMRVFVRAGKDLFGTVEAYQVVWGSILEPQ